MKVNNEPRCVSLVADLLRLMLLLIMWAAVLEFISKNWNTLSSAPLAFLGVMGIGLLLGWFLGQQYYKQQVLVLQTELGLSKDNIESLRLKLGEIPKTSRFTTLSNKEISKLALAVAKNIRSMLTYKEKTTKTKKIQRNSAENNLILLGTPEVEEYREKYHADAINLRMEMRERLPIHLEVHGIADVVFADTFSVDYIEIVADELERLAKALPSRPE